MSLSESKIESLVAAYYTEKVLSHGETPQGVDWNSAESQFLRFEQLLKLCEGQRAFTLLDYGCGWGALLEHLLSRGFDVSYTGFDIAAEMINRARVRHASVPRATFAGAEEDIAPSDYAVASGVFNVKLQVADDEWHAYVLRRLERLHSLCRLGFAFNMLSLYSDRDRRRPHLHYADPLLFFDHCKRKFSRHVALLHDYQLYEFTILVRREKA